MLIFRQLFDPTSSTYTYLLGDAGTRQALLIDPVFEQARRDGVPDNWLEAARNSPVYKMAVQWRVALPLHPEYRTLPMVWPCVTSVPFSTVRLSRLV